MKNIASLFTLFCLSCGTPVMAQHELVVELQNGDTQSYVLSKKPVISFSNSKMIIVSREEESFETELSDVKGFRIGLIDEEDAIVSVAENEVRFVRLGANVQIYGLKDADKAVRVYDMAGRSAAATVRMNGSQADVILEGLPKGCYVIRVGNKQSIKVTK